MTKIIDNFLDNDYFLRLNNLVTSYDLPWYFQNDINDEQSKDDLYFYFTHILYSNNQPNSEFFTLFEPLLNKMNYEKLIRVKLNLYPRTEKLRINPPHIDNPDEHKGFLFYFNTCDSKTVLKDMHIDCVANRAVYFNPTIPHASSSCTNVKARFSLNVNYA